MAKLSALGFVFLVGSMIAACGPNNRDNFGDDDGHERFVLHTGVGH